MIAKGANEEKKTRERRDATSASYALLDRREKHEKKTRNNTHGTVFVDHGQLRSFGEVAHQDFARVRKGAYDVEIALRGE